MDGRAVVARDPSGRAPTMSEPANPIAVQVRGLVVRYADTATIGPIDLDLPCATWTCILGRSGVGKSTLLRAIAGPTPPAAGTVLGPQGADVAGCIAWMAQSDLLCPWLDARANVLLGARLRGEPVDAAARAKADGLLRDVGLEPAALLRPAQLSGGMRQRVALARTLAEDRPVVLMDEPFTGLDSQTRVAMQDLAWRLLRGRTVLMVTHDPWEALRLSDQIHLWRPGHGGALAPIPPLPRGDGPGADDGGLPPPDDPALALRHARLLADLIADRR